MGSFHSDIKFVSPMTKTLHRDAQGTNLTLSDDLIALGGASIGNNDNPLAGQLKLGVAAGSGYLTFYPGSYVPGHIDGSELLFDISGAEALKLLSTGHLRLRSNKMLKSRNAADDADLDLIGRNGSNNPVLFSGLTGVLKASSSVITAAGLLNADVDAAAAIAATKLAAAPKARVYNSGAITCGNGSLTTLTFNSERFDNDTMHDTSSNTSRLTATTAGLYLITATVRWTSNATGYRQLLLRHQGGTYFAVDTVPAVNGTVTDQTITGLYQMAANEYAEIQAVQNSGGDLNITANGNYSPEFAMVRVSA